MDHVAGLGSSELGPLHAESLCWRVADTQAVGVAGFVNLAQGQLYYTPEYPHMGVRGMAQ